MNTNWTNIWDTRYSIEELAYGKEPNQFFKEQIDKLSIGKILFPAEGEGRNAVYAAKLGWSVDAFDISMEGKNKAELLASSLGVQLNYQVGELENLDYSADTFDALALIYAHFPSTIKSKYHQVLATKLKKGGLVIFEAFSKNHLPLVTANPNVGGPKDIASLFSIEEIQSDFNNFDIIQLEEKEIELKEGLFHNGIGSVIRFVGVKK